MTFPLRGTTVLVTGGAGLIGSHIVDLLVSEGANEIHVLDNLARGRKENLFAASARRPITFIEGDVRDRGTVHRAVDGCDYVFHQAAIRITRCAERPRECIDVLVNGTFNVFEAAVSAGVRKVVYASSASIYGAAETFPTNEKHHPYDNRTLYGAAKLMNEGIARSFYQMYGLPSVGLRYFNVYGPRMDVTGAYTELFIRWLNCVEQGTPPEIHSTPPPGKCQPGRYPCRISRTSRPSRSSSRSRRRRSRARLAADAARPLAARRRLRLPESDPGSGVRNCHLPRRPLRRLQRRRLYLVLRY